jgi:methylated-DNA-[protein]-cysteine S-methyltransferase
MTRYHDASHDDASYDDALIAMLIDGVPPAREVTRWLRTEAGRRRLAGYRHVLGDLGRLYGALRPRTIVYWCSLPSPVGRVLVAASDAGLVRVGFRRTEASFVDQLRRTLDAEPVRSPARTAEIVHQLRAYFAGERRAFDLRIDLRNVSPFLRRVLAAAASVPPGQVVSYGEIARRIGQPSGSRAVGQALGRNPVRIVIPCHRVIAAGGKIGGYGGGLRMKRILLRLEGARLAAG